MNRSVIVDPLPRQGNSGVRVCVVGLGYVGLPTACLLASRGYRVHGVDIDSGAVERVRQGGPVAEPGLSEILAAAIGGTLLSASCQPVSSNVFLICVPTPLGPENTPDVSQVFAAAEAITPHLTEGALVCVESTCPIGTTEAIAARLPSGVHVAYCPERVLPGRILDELVGNDRVVGGVSSVATERAVEFYRGFVSGHVVGTNARTAEAVKLAENSYRDVNIAFANELSMIAERVGFDARAVIRLANRHPRVQILDPGPGVGGHCVAVDPWFLVSAAPDLARLTRMAREVNLAKAAWVVDRVREHLRPDAVVACLGLAYKPDVDDVRESPARAVVDALSAYAVVLAVDPHLPGTVPLLDALRRADIVVGLVAHTAFRGIDRGQLLGKVVLDFAGVLT